MPTWQVIFLGLIEGLTEYIPVSSTGHLLLAEHFLGFRSPGRAFEVLIQLGAILALLTVYFAKLLRMARDLPYDRRTRCFVLGILLAFVPAGVLGVLGHSFIKTVLFETPALVCVTLILGGILLLVLDRFTLEVCYRDVMDFPPTMALKIGLFQCLALIPGVSRSGATIVGALALGADKRSAAEFSFFLAIPTMIGAFAYDLYKNWGEMRPETVTGIALGFIAAFISGVFVVRYLLDFVSRHGFRVFAWWRIIVGAAGLVGLGLLA